MSKISRTAHSGKRESPDHGRKYRGARSYALPIWNGIFDHFDRMGPAIWVFLWCIDGITKETDGAGIVHGGAPIKAKRIATDLKGSNEDVILRHLRRLAGQKYIRSRRTPYGFVIEVLNSKKFGIWKPKENRQKVGSQSDRESTNSRFSPEREPTNSSERTDDSSAENRLFVGNKEDSAVTLQEDRAFAVGVDVSVGALGMDGEREKGGEALSHTHARRSTAGKGLSERISPLFDEFYRQYPRKVGRKRALAAWRKIVGTNDNKTALIAEIMAGLEHWKTHAPRWKYLDIDPKDVQYIPYAQSFLEAELWRDAPEGIPPRDEPEAKSARTAGSPLPRIYMLCGMLGYENDEIARLIEENKDDLQALKESLEKKAPTLPNHLRGHKSTV